MLVDQDRSKNLSLTAAEQSALEIWKSQSETIPASPEGRKIIRDQLEAQVKLLFANKEGASNIRGKSESVSDQTSQYLDLFFQAQAEGSISMELTTGQIFSLVSENISALALQDRAASETQLGDHGIRHLVDHNIKVAMELADGLAAQGINISAMDRLMLHQVMIYHDLGYAMDPVAGIMRENAETGIGPKGEDVGHNVLAAKYVRGKFNDNNDIWHQVFDNKNFNQIQRAILYHDLDENGLVSIKFNTDPNSQTEETRQQNIESIVRTADNTHAFEDKLPEILYTFPESLKIMRLMKTAGETGDTESVEILKKSLQTIIENNPDISADDKKALKLAAGTLTVDSYKFNVDRICGNEPTYSFDDTGNLIIEVGVSDIHSEVVRIFSGESLAQYEKMQHDVFGQVIRGEMPGETRSKDGRVILRRRSGEKRTKFQERINSLLSEDKPFMAFVVADKNYLDQLVFLQQEKDIISHGGTGGLFKSEAEVEAEIANINDLRRSLLVSQVNSYHQTNG